MSVLDTFFTLFKSSGVEEVEKDNERVKKSNDKLEDSLKGSQKTSDDLTRSFKGLGGELVGMATAGLSAAALLSKLKSSFNYSLDLKRASMLLNANVEDLDAWGGAVEKTGGNVKTFEQSLQNLAMHLGTTGDVALKVLPQFADSFQKLGRYGSLRYGHLLGMDESLILLLQKGRGEVEALIKQQKELGIITTKDAEASLKFNNELQNTDRVFRTLFAETVTSTLPALTQVLNSFSDAGTYLQNHQAAIKGALIAIGAAALYAAKGLFTLKRARLGLAIGAAGIVYEDVKAYREGKNSAIGDFRNWFYRKALEYDQDRIQKGLKPLHDRSSTELSPLPIDHKNIRDFKEPLTIRPEELEELLPKAKAALGITTSVTLPSANNLATPSIANRNISINIGDINIQAQTNDVKSLTKAIDDTLKEQLRQALYNFDNGVLT
jgi:hypothetical protein